MYSLTGSVGCNPGRDPDGSCGGGGGGGQHLPEDPICTGIPGGGSAPITGTRVRL